MFTVRLFFATAAAENLLLLGAKLLNINAHAATTTATASTALAYYR
jgi:hypothetical protein